MDYEASENSKEASKEKGSSRNTTPNSLNGMTILNLYFVTIVRHCVNNWLLINKTHGNSLRSGVLMRTTHTNMGIFFSKKF
jgi:hypothetical protein